MATNNFGYTETKYKKKKPSPEIEDSIARGLFVDIIESIIDNLGSEQEFDELVFKVRDKRLDSQFSVPEDFKTLKQLTKESFSQMIKAAYTMRSVISNRLLGSNEKTNIFMSINSVKSDLQNQMSSETEAVMKKLEPILKVVENLEA